MSTKTITARQWAGLLAMIAIVAIFAGAAAAAELAGTVRDHETGEPIAGAAVKIKGTGIGTVTDSEGRYRLADTPSADRHGGFPSDTETAQRPGCDSHRHASKAGRNAGGIHQCHQRRDRG